MNQKREIQKSRLLREPGAEQGQIVEIHRSVVVESAVVGTAACLWRGFDHGRAHHCHTQQHHVQVSRN